MTALWVVAALTCWSPPVDAPVSRPFDGPPCTWCAGHRGLEFATAPGTPVAAVESGVVSFAGVVAGAGFVTVTTAAGVQVTYGYLGSWTVARATSVAAGQVIGRTGRPLLLTVRVLGVYVDPAAFLGTVRWPLRLVPTDGSPPRPPGPPRLSCPSRARPSSSPSSVAAPALADPRRR